MDCLSVHAHNNGVFYLTFGAVRNYNILKRGEANFICKLLHGNRQEKSHRTFDYWVRGHYLYSNLFYLKYFCLLFRQ